MDPVQKTLLDVWGVPGLLLALSLGALVWLLRRLLESMESRIREALDMAEKNGQRLQDQTIATRELTSVVNSVLARLK